MEMKNAKCKIKNKVAQAFACAEELRRPCLRFYQSISIKLKHTILSPTSIKVKITGEA